MRAIVECPTCHSHKIYVDDRYDLEVCSQCGETGVFPLFLTANSTYAAMMEELQKTKAFYKREIK